MTLITTDAAGLVAGGVLGGMMGREEKKEEVANYEVLAGFCVGDAENVFPGDVIELADSQARRWLGPGYIQKTDKKAGPAPQPKEPHRKIVIRDPQALRNRDPK